MEALATSAVLVAFAEIGDKTQILSILLAARLRRPWPIVGGIAIATVANHALAGSVGVWVAGRVDATVLRWLVGLAFVGFGVWTLRPDTFAGDVRQLGGGALVTTIVAFFLAEMGDKTQLATVALGARYPGQLLAVVTGTTAGMLVANVPAVLAGDALAARLPMRAIRRVAAGLFVAMGVATILAG
jgi:Ca2+/H+ antiporter, TMEM165/GDT1 family